MNTVHATRDEAIRTHITEPLGDEAANHDIDAIADKTIARATDRPGYTCTVDTDEFWTIVANHAK